MVCAVGNAKARETIIRKLTGMPQLHFATLTDPSAELSQSVTAGEGCIICAGNILTVDISIGNHTIINLDCTVGHDAVLGDFVTLYPGVHISGNVAVGNATEIGTGTQVIQGIHIGKESVIGAGAVVVRDIPDGCTAVGNPAKVIKYR